MAWPVVSIDLTLCNLTPKGKEALGTAMATLATAHHRPSKLMAIRTDEWSVELGDTELDLSNLGKALLQASHFISFHLISSHFITFGPNHEIDCDTINPLPSPPRTTNGSHHHVLTTMRSPPSQGLDLSDASMLAGVIATHKHLQRVKLDHNPSIGDKVLKFF